MSNLMIRLISFSVVTLAALSVYRGIQNKNWRLLTLQIIALVLCLVLLRGLFDFPSVPKPLIDRGDDEEQQEVYFVIVLYFCMLLGMGGQYLFNRFEHPETERKKFDVGLFIAPVFASPIIFIPLLAALQNADIDLVRLTVPKTMVFFVAFENGFFWKAYFDQRRQERESNES
jgi:hypothetical protein